MAVHISNPEIDRNIRELVEITGESISEAVNQSVKDRLKKLKPRVPPPDYLERVMEAARQIREKLDPNDHRTIDELVGYDEHGLPT